MIDVCMTIDREKLARYSCNCEAAFFDTVEQYVKNDENLREFTASVREDYDFVRKEVEWYGHCDLLLQCPPPDV